MSMTLPHEDTIIKCVCQCRRYLLVLLLSLGFAGSTRAFSVLAHEAIIDASWDNHLCPLLLKRYPTATPAQLDSALAYAYGGSLIADMGSVPFGSQYFTDLLHYVRSGDFVNTLLADAQTLNEYAFALGAISHYVADKYGHALATNLAVSMAYPKLRKKFGGTVTYNDDHTSHSAMEFAFDVIQTAKGNYASMAYHNSIGFSVATPALKRAFSETYGQRLEAVFPNFESAVSRFRWAVGKLLPQLARFSRRADDDGMMQSRANIQGAAFSFNMPRQAARQKIGHGKTTAALTAGGLALLIETMPKLGPLKKLRFRYPGVACEKLFLRSMDTILVNYAAIIQQAGMGTLALSNINFDTGRPSAEYEYSLADKTYKNWLLRLSADKSARLSEAIFNNIRMFYRKNENGEIVAALKMLSFTSQ